MDDQDEALRKAREFADTAHSAAVGTRASDLQKELADIERKRAAKGVLEPDGTAMEMAAAYGRHINGMVQARLEGLLEGCELHGPSLDERFAGKIAEDVLCLQEKLLADCGRATDQSTRLATRHAGREQFAQLVRFECKASLRSVDLEIQRRIARR